MDMEQDIPGSIEKVKTIVKGDMCTKSYDVPKPLYLEMYASGVSLGARLL